MINIDFLFYIAIIGIAFILFEEFFNFLIKYQPNMNKLYIKIIALILIVPISVIMISICLQTIKYYIFGG